MTCLTMRYHRGDLLVTGPDIESVTFKTRREAWAWCLLSNTARKCASLTDINAGPVIGNMFGTSQPSLSPDA